MKGSAKDYLLPPEVLQGGYITRQMRTVEASPPFSDALASAETGRLLASPEYISESLPIHRQSSKEIANLFFFNSLAERELSRLTQAVVKLASLEPIDTCNRCLDLGCVKLETYTFRHFRQTA